MRKNWLLIGVALLMGILTVSAVACSDSNDDDDGEETPAMEDETPEAVSELSATITEVDGSGVSGSATLTEVDGVAQIEVSYEGLPEGPHANHAHHGSCEEQGEIHVTLQEAQPDAEGSASATTSAEPPAVDPAYPLSHFAEGHYVAVHAEGDDTIGDVIGCGNIE